MAAQAPLSGILVAPPPEDLFRVGSIVEQLCGDGIFQLHENVALTTAVESVLRHTLGRVPKGVHVISKSAFADVMDAKKRRTSERIFLTADADVVVDLLIF